MNNHNYLVKLIIIGDTSVGKSSILQIYCDNYINSEYVSTIGVDFRIKTINLNNDIIKLQIWDTAGQERFRSITNSYYRGAHAIMLVFDLTDIYTFNRLDDWMQIIYKNTGTNKFTILLVGNKLDQTKKICVTKNDIDKFISKYDLEYIEVSAKLNTNINDAFNKIISNFMKLKTNNLHNDKSNVTLNGQKINRKCCN
jgi:small GTP-binding protein